MACPMSVDDSGWPRPRSTSATVAATADPSAASQIAAQAASRMRSRLSASSDVALEPRAGRGPSVVCHQQLVCAELPVLDDSTVPSLVVIEQLSLLTRNRLDACTEPTSDCEIGVTVSDHGM